VLREEPAFSTYKFRLSEGMVKRVIDYIFIRDKHFSPVGYLQLPNEDDID
jgi:hypothetical protein